MDNWISTLERLPEVGQKVWYHYEYIGTWEGTYLGEKYQEWEEESYPCFEGERNYWVADCETFWQPWEEEKPELIYE